MMNKEQKKNYNSEMTEKFENSKAIMVTHYQGLTMPQLDELRSKMREHGIVFKITKNRITKLALEKTKCKDLSNLFTGPTAVGPVNKFAKSLHFVFSRANFVILFFVILKTMPCSLIFDLKSSSCVIVKPW